MNEEFNNPTDSQAESDETLKTTLNGEELGAKETAARTGKLAIAVISLSLVAIVAIICVIVFLKKKPADTEVSVDTSISETVSESSETSVSESVSEETPAEETVLEAPDYSECLTEEGFIKDADLTKVTDLALINMEIPYSSVEYIDDKVESDLLSAAENYAYFDPDPARTVENGHTIMLDYSGSIDGVKFDGGTAEDQTLVIGSHSFIDDFEEQLIGSHPGDDVTVTVSFPETYSNNPDLAGKEAVFECHVDSIHTIPEVDDEFVQTYFSEYADSVEGLKAYVKELNTQSNIETYIASYISENASASELPEAYVESLKNIIRYEDQQYFLQYQAYLMYYGYTDLASMSFSDYTGMSDEEYEKQIDESAYNQAVLDLTYESIYRNEGLTYNEDYYNQIVEYYGGESGITHYGVPYFKQLTIKYTVIQHIKENASILDSVTE